MALNQIQQIYEALERAEHPLIVTKRVWNLDSICSGLGVLKLAQKLEKRADFVCEDFRTHEKIKFLPHVAEVKPEIKNLNKFIIKLDTSKTRVNELSYDHKGDSLEIHVSPKQGNWSAIDVKSEATPYRHDLILCVDTPDLENVGKTYEQYADFFYKTPIINLDTNPANEHYGQINYVDFNPASSSELVYSLFDNINRNFIDEDLATLLLAGMIAKTNSFKSPNITPQTLATASQLVSLGARREEIINNLFRTRTIATLRLWGRALARLKNHEETGIVWTMLSAQDFMHAGAGPTDLEDVIQELITTYPKARVAFILFEHENKINCVLNAERPLNALDLTSTWQGQGETERAKFSLPGASLVQAEEQIIGRLKQGLAKV